MQKKLQLILWIYINSLFWEKKSKHKSTEVLISVLPPLMNWSNDLMLNILEIASCPDLKLFAFSCSFLEPCPARSLGSKTQVLFLVLLGKKMRRLLFNLCLSILWNVIFKRYWFITIWTARRWIWRKHARSASSPHKLDWFPSGPFCNSAAAQDRCLSEWSQHCSVYSCGRPCSVGFMKS